MIRNLEKKLSKRRLIQELPAHCYSHELANPTLLPSFGCVTYWSVSGRSEAWMSLPTHSGSRGRRSGQPPSLPLCGVEEWLRSGCGAPLGMPPLEGCKQPVQTGEAPAVLCPLLPCQPLEREDPTALHSTAQLCPTVSAVRLFLTQKHQQAGI